MEFPKLWKIAATGLGGCLASRAPVSMSKALCATASTTENHEIKMKTEIPHDPIILLLCISAKQGDQYVRKMTAYHAHSAKMC